MVDLDSRQNSFLVNLERMLDFPTTESPIGTILNKNGISSSFWYHTWALLGPLISVLEEHGPRMLRIRKDATVSEAVRDGNWVLPSARSPEAVVWFREHIPRNAFITWLVLLRRLPTRDRLRRWGLNVPASCVLCSTGVETHHHLFFECEFSSTLWKHFAQGIIPAVPSDIHSAAALISLNRLGPKASAVIKLILQYAIYLIWRLEGTQLSYFHLRLHLC
ncbi:uncharacterized protein LOC106359192 [Brassica napus]|uniref:uncharacterized protein LOC106330847 n=1 Tax=Brassica oleracea var. oleracea TaxID=109376 RepID=UPI0006A6C2F3|nr:PREDICTED: uncharacterized protein LOC106330847 [Brassica oleracea var. oleracea]XP_013654381.1 uncharacterized protein LOC106359192 [Brassica napus]